ncbi:MAG: hypothetical protein N2746_08500 [Deltaproteobacteria bacterium]|nr:hypothetical protein [Deltaproteobacteria bacterium]
MKVLLKILLILVLALFFVGADKFYVDLNYPGIEGNRIEEDKSALLVDYNKIKKGFSNFYFFPIYFYVSQDGCFTSIEKIKKEEAIDLDICVGFNVVDDFHYLRFELITPDKAVYQNVNLFVDSKKSALRLVRFNTDYTPHRVIKPITLNGVEFVKSRIPIAGSSIQAQNLIGIWNIHLFIDNSPDIKGIVSFEIE